MSIINKIPAEVKEVAKSEAIHFLDDYINTEPKTNYGRYFRKVAMVVKIILPFVKINKP
jgi:hypothetical protein